MKVRLLGGFLGAGKTTLARALADHLQGVGERVALVTNDQGRLLVDTLLCREVSTDVHEVSGGCFCCRYPELERALAAAADAGATTVIAEAVGSCTDIVATVLAPLAHRHAQPYALEPYAVVVDPWRVKDVAAGRVSDEIAYLVRKQIEEADVILLSRADLAPPDVTDRIRDWQPHAPIIPVSARSGVGIEALLRCQPARLAAPLAIDYDRYAAAEAQLAWFNGAVWIHAEQNLNVEAIMRRFFEVLSDAPIAHVKLTGAPPFRGWGALVRRGARASIVPDPMDMGGSSVRWIVNARVAMAPDALRTLLANAMATAAAAASVTWEEVECFSPARPVPTHRYAVRCAVEDEASCCSAFYQRADVRTLLGESFHPGGLALTRQVAAALDLERDDVVLDVACGTGASLREIVGAYPVSGVGLDAGGTPLVDGRVDLRVGDAHAIPLGSASVDAVLCECALSTFMDQPGALGEIFRVLRPNGRVAITDMVLEGEVPESLREWVHSGTCLERALTADAYARALTDAGFVVVDRWDARGALHEVLLRIKRNLVGMAFAASSGAVSAVPQFDARSARRTLREAERAVDAGIIRYGVFIAERPSVVS